MIRKIRTWQFEQAGYIKQPSTAAVVLDGVSADCKQSGSGGLGDCGDGGMLDPAFGRYGIKSFLDLFCASDDANAILVDDILLDCRG